MNTFYRVCKTHTPPQTLFNPNDPQVQWELPPTFSSKVFNARLQPELLFKGSALGTLATPTAI